MRHDVLDLARALTTRVLRLRHRRGRGAIEDQLRRAALSVSLNLAESTGYAGAARANYLRIADGSLRETELALGFRGGQAVDLLAPAIAQLRVALAREIRRLSTESGGPRSRRRGRRGPC